MANVMDKCNIITLQMNPIINTVAEYYEIEYYETMKYSKMTINIFISIPGNMKGLVWNKYEFLLSIDNVTKERFWISLVTSLCHRQN